MADLMTRQEFAECLIALETRLTAALDRREQTWAIGFDEIQRDVRLALEAIETLRQQTSRRFDESRKNQFREIALTLDVLRHVRRRVDRMDALRE